MKERNNIEYHFIYIAPDGLVVLIISTQTLKEFQSSGKIYNFPDRANNVCTARTKGCSQKELTWTLF